MLSGRLCGFKVRVTVREDLALLLSEWFSSEHISFSLLFWVFFRLREAWVELKEMENLNIRVRVSRENG